MTAGRIPSRRSSPLSITTTMPVLRPGASPAESIAMTTATTICITKATGISAAHRHTIIVREAHDRHGRFQITLVDGSTLPASRTPILSAARFLLSEGANPDAVIEMRHASTPGAVALSGRLGTAAKLEVHEGQTSGPRFCKWRPPPQDRG